MFLKSCGRTRLIKVFFVDGIMEQGDQLDNQIIHLQALDLLLSALSVCKKDGIGVCLSRLHGGDHVSLMIVLENVDFIENRFVVKDGSLG